MKVHAFLFLVCLAGGTVCAEMVAHWDFDYSGSYLVRDQGPYEYDGYCREGSSILYGAIVEEAGWGKVLELDGIDDYVDLDICTQLNQLQLMNSTLSLWIKTSDSTTASALISNYVDNPAWILDLQNNQVRLCLNGTNYYGPSGIADGNWHHIAVVCRRLPPGDIGVFMYLDGAEYIHHPSITASFVVASDHPTMIGRSPVAGATAYFDGRMDIIRIYNDALTGQEIADLYNNDRKRTLTVQPSPSTVVGSIALDPPGGVYLQDSSVTLTAIPEPGFSFASWSGDASESTNPLTITMDDDKNITANFSFDGDVIYVDIDAAGANNGTSWTDAFTDLQHARAVARSGREIRVAAGTYTPTRGTDRSISFSMRNGVGIYGGFDGTETERDQRDIQANPTILSGNIGQPDDIGDNSYHVLYNTSLNATAILDGFTISDGCVVELDDYSGAGMYNHNSDPTVRNCLFTKNIAHKSGAGMYNYISDPTIINCVFYDNQANTSASGGAGVYNNYSDPILINCTFTYNLTDGHGGGMYNNYGNPTLINCIFNENYTYCDGGGIYNDNCYSIKVYNCIFYNNHVTDYGGGIYNDGGHNLTISNCIFRNNTAGAYGDEIYNSGSSFTSKPIISCCTLEDFFSSSYGIDGGGNMTNTNPMFVDANGADNTSGTLDDDFRLLPGSPCIDAGNNNFNVPDKADLDGDGITAEAIPYDADGNSRYCNDPSVVDTGFSPVGHWPIVDIGAYEHPGIVPIEGDVDGDGDVDMADLAKLAANWLAGTGE